MNWQSFYSPTHISLAYGVGGHRGVDYSWHNIEGTDIPAWCSGTVVTKGWSAGHGYYIGIRRIDGVLVFYCHMESATPLLIGTSISAGQNVGKVGHTGSLATGPHLHTMVTRGEALGSPMFNPIQLISTGTVTTAGGNETPLPTRRKRPMATLYYRNVPRLYAFAGDSPGTPANWIESADAGFATALSALVGAPSIELDNATFDLFKGMYLAPLRVTGGSQQASPTAEQIATATVNEQAKRLVS